MAAYGPLIPMLLAVLFIASVIAMWVLSLNPLAKLKQVQPREHERITAVFWFHLYGFTLYLAIGDYKKCIESKEISASLNSAAVVARLQILVFAIGSVYMVAT